MSPRVLILLSDDNVVVLPVSGASYYLELYRHDMLTSLHVYPPGDHGLRYDSSFRYRMEMQLELQVRSHSF